jgi:hypothetical protein
VCERRGEREEEEDAEHDVVAGGEEPLEA